jgi:predicted unusual protein kinase regulating ubiquinone biosynthesis (AarF/ABC1/UbiB family)
MDGEEVAGKVQRPDLLFDVALDIYVLRIGVRMHYPTQNCKPFQRLLVASCLDFVVFNIVN